MSYLKFFKIASKLTSVALAAKGAKSPNAAGATSKLLKSFIKCSSHRIKPNYSNKISLFKTF